MKARQIEVNCAGCGKQATTTLIKNQVMIPTDWVQIHMRRRSEDGMNSQQCGQALICKAECATEAVAKAFQ